MSTPSRDAKRKSPFDRAGLYVVIICGTLALSILAWAASLPDGITN